MPREHTSYPRAPNVSLDDVLITDALERRPSRDTDFAAENRALVTVAEAMENSEAVLQTLVETALELCNADSAGVSILESTADGELWRWYAIAGDYAGNLDQVLTQGEAPCDIVLSTGGVVLFDQPGRYFRTLEQTTPVIHESLLTPFYCDREPVGTLWTLSHTPGARFDAEDARVLDRLSRFASAAYQLIRARDRAEQVQQELEQRVEERTAELTRAYESLRESEAEFRALIEATSDAVYRMSPDWKEMRQLHGGDFLKDTRRPDHQWLDKYIHPEDQTRVLEAIDEAIRTKSVFELEHRVRLEDGSLGWTLSRAVPVLGTDGEIKVWFGAASDMTGRKRAEEALRENERRLSERVREATTELRSLSRRLLTVQEAERRHIAYELHDEVGQALTGLAFSLEMAKRSGESQHLEHAESITRDLMAQVRSLTLQLRPSVLDDMGLLPALLALAERFTDRTGVHVDLYHEGADRRFPSDIETVAYRVVQEALTNVARHSGASQSQVRIVATAETLTIWISDAGVGFDVGKLRGSGESSGLVGMHERASLVGGSVSIESIPNDGTMVILELPLIGEDDENTGTA